MSERCRAFAEGLQKCFSFNYITCKEKDLLHLLVPHSPGCDHILTTWTNMFITFEETNIFCISTILVTLTAHLQARSFSPGEVAIPVFGHMWRIAAGWFIMSPLSKCNACGTKMWLQARLPMVAWRGRLQWKWDRFCDGFKMKWSLYSCVQGLYVLFKIVFKTLIFSDFYRPVVKQLEMYASHPCRPFLSELHRSYRSYRTIEA